MARVMKDSGVEWIGNIPLKWNVSRTKSNYLFHKEIVGTESSKYERLALTLNGVIKRSKDDSKGLQPSDFDTYQILRKGELVFKLIDLANVATSRVGYSPFIGLVSPAYIVLKPKINTWSKFGEYFFLSMWQREVFNNIGDNGVRSSLNSSDLLSIPYIVPPIEEQQRIASFLDSKCQEIDNVLAKTRSSIEEYKKLKQAIITKAVTKGIHSNRKMKDSGIEWIGEIPEEWSIAALKMLCKMQAGKNLTTEQILEEGKYPVYGGNGQRGFYNEYNQEGAYLLIGRQGALCGNVHKVTGKFWATEHAVIADLSSIANIDFLYYLIIGMNLNQYASNSAAQPGLSVGYIANVRTCIVPLYEQIEIATYLNNKCLEIDKLILKKEQLISELESYKKSLIYEYVTGKKEVPMA